MKIRLYFPILANLVLFFCAVSFADSQVVKKQAPANQVKNEQAAIARLRKLYSSRDFETGYQLGRKLVRQFPGNTELNAWFAANMARNEMRREAVEAAKKLVESNKENAWAWFALANAYIRNSQTKEAVPAAEKALKLMPEDEEFIFLYASTLLAQKKYDEVYAWLDKNSAKIKDRARLLYTRAEAQYRQATNGKIDETKKRLSFETFAKAREISPNFINAIYIYASYLNLELRFAEAYPLLKKAVALAPNVVHIRQQFWKAILQGQPNKSEEQRKAEVIADSNNLLCLRPDSINALKTISAVYEQELEMPDKKKEFDRIILKKYPQSAQSELILILQIRRFSTRGKDGKDDVIKKRQLVQKIRNFINRPKHFEESYLGESYSNLFYHLKDDKNVSDAELLRIAEETTKYLQWGVAGMYSTISRSLTDRKMFRQAENILNIGFVKVKGEIENQRAAIKNEKELEKNLNEMNAVLYSARGWIYFKENRLDEAEKEFIRAIKLNNQISYIYNGLGQVYEAKKDFEKAEDAYINAYSTFYGKGNPNGDALKNLYQKRSGKSDGFEAYFEKVKVIERDRRKERILSTKIIDAANATPFTLKNLEAKQISFADLKGKIIVLNIWGTWCGPCVMEMPEFQELHRKYDNDKDVAILTINNDADSETVKKFMTDKKYDFAVLRDEKYLETVDINVFPTTWFIDRDGKVSFIKVGANDKLLEEFGWRIEELKKQR
jgi:tetratricopeptide (TPR) repeat protein